MGQLPAAKGVATSIVDGTVKSWQPREAGLFSGVVLNSECRILSKNLWTRASLRFALITNLWLADNTFFKNILSHALDSVFLCK